MDPLSISAGAVGFITFAAQMAKLAARVKRSVEQFRSASREADELAAKLGILEMVCGAVEMNLGRQQQASSSSSLDAIVTDAMSAALAQCYCKVERLDQALARLAAGPSRREQALSSARLFFRRDELRAMAAEVDGAVTTLQIVINTATWLAMALFAPSCPTYQSDQEEERSTSVGKRQDHASRVDETFSSLPRVASWPPSNQVLNITRKKEYPPMCFGPVTWQVFETCVDDGDEGLGTNRSRKGRIKLRIPFTWWQMRFEYVPSMGCPSYALNVDHIIPEDSRLGLEIEDTFMSKNLHELKTALSERRLSLYSSWGCINLFYLALFVKWAEGLKYLLENDARKTFLQDGPPRKLFTCESRFRPDTPCEVTETLLSQKHNDIQTGDVNILIDSELDAEYLARYLRRFLSLPMVDTAELLDFAWWHMLRIFGALFHEMTVPTTPSWWRIRTQPAHHIIPGILKIFIEQGFNVNKLGHSFSRYSAYMAVLFGVDHPFDADDAIHQWLKALQEAGVFIRPYVECELQNLSQSGVKALRCIDGERKRLVVMIRFGDVDVPSWRWRHNPASAAFEVLDEFKNLGQDGLTPLLTWGPQEPAHARDYKCWFDYNEPVAAWSYPFRRRNVDLFSVDRRLFVGKPCDMGRHGPETQQLALAIREGRFARREARRWRKAHPGHKRHREKMPGSWVD